jgi:tryptophan synthase alpha chain
VLEAHTLEAALTARIGQGRKCLVPYLTAGCRPDWLTLVSALGAGGADAIEIGIAFSDPMIDGEQIQIACQRALAAGTTPESVLTSLAERPRKGEEPPLVVMTYYNIALHRGLEHFASDLADAGVSGCILPDLPLEEMDPWAEAAGAAGIATVLLAAPSSPDARVAEICRRSQGFVYGVGLMGVTGERDALARSALAVAARLKAATTKPVLVGVGVSNREQAVRVGEVADGAIVGSAVVRRVLEGQAPEDVAEFVRSIRAGLDELTGQPRSQGGLVT